MVEQLAHPEGSKVVIEMWADLGCPWCYVGKHRLQAAIAQRPDADRFEIVMRSFELDPGALAWVAELVGLDGRRVREILASDEYADRVRADRDEATRLGGGGVPFVVVDRKVGARGAQKVPAYGRLLDQVAGPVPSERAS